MNKCRICNEVTVVELLDLGMHPISNRFLADLAAEEDLHPMVIGQCNVCGLVQLINPVPADELLSPYEWITYNEPERHLDQLVDVISTLPGISGDATICGISYKDDSTLARFKQRGFDHAWRIDTDSDLGITDAGAGIETIQDRLCFELASTLWQKYGAPDVVIARHILEHAYDTPRFMEALSRLVKPTGYVVLEVPDCTRVLKTLDYSTIWEEHILYFTLETFQNCFCLGGFSLDRLMCYPYPYEDSLVGIARPQRETTPAFPSENVLENEKQRAQDFAQGLSQRRYALSRFLREYRKSRGKIAMFGAGHLACMFINVMGLAGDITFVVDDHPHKRGLFMPGSRLPIHSSDVLIEENVKLCLTSLTPESEEKVIENNQAFVDQGGEFASIFPASKHALRV